MLLFERLKQVVIFMVPVVLAKENIILSRRRIGRIMRKFDLVSKYTEKHYKAHTTNCNEAPVKMK